MKRVISAFFLLIVSISLLSCGKLTGQFAFRTDETDAYRKMPDDMEIAEDKPVDWVFAVDSVRGVHHVYVIVQKKELVWAEVKKENVEVEKLSPWVHGRIENLEPGEYKIVLAEQETLIAEKPFVIYGPSDDEGGED